MAGEAAGRHRPPLRPLYVESAEARLISTTVGNAGLWYDKFCDRWNAGWDGLGDSGKRDWIATIANLDGTAAKRVGDRELLAEAAARQSDLTKKLGGRTFSLATAWRFASGLGRSHPVENGFAWHHGLGVPYLPGSGVKGVARAWAGWEGVPTDDIDRIFGPTEAGAVGSVIFLDALPVKPVALDADVMTPHYAPWYQADRIDWSKPEARDRHDVPGDWHSPVPIPFLTVAPGQTFQFALLPRTPGDADECERAETLLRDALKKLGAGAKTAAGYGVFAEASTEASSGSAGAESPVASTPVGKTAAKLPSGTLVQARLTGKNKKDKWKAVHDGTGVEAVIEGNPPDSCKDGQLHELLCTSATNFKWPTPQDRQRLAQLPRKPGSNQTGRGKGAKRR